MERLNLRLCLGAATLVCVTAGLCFAITATTGFAARTSKSVRIPLYTNAVFPGAALTCTMGNTPQGLPPGFLPPLGYYRGRDLGLLHQLPCAGVEGAAA